MSLTFKSLTNYLEGQWVCNQTIYSLKTKKIYNHKFTTEIPSLESLNYSHLQNIVCITKIKNQYTIYQYMYPYLLNNQEGFINKIENKKIQKYIFVLNSSKILKITNCMNNIKYTEYIYFIDENFKLSFGLMKMNNKYKSISFTSDIKISTAYTNSIDLTNY
uniref:hypothetical protein n=1 Tax=Hypnea flava TaxID=1524266 RepID=UPI0027DA371D|nr:hypothetical protein REP59_pgp120 [Hypnea flava]WCH54914.1 hypothetical protein [Hypnea flava]